MADPTLDEIRARLLAKLDAMGEHVAEALRPDVAALLAALDALTTETNRAQRGERLWEEAYREQRRRGAADYAEVARERDEARALAAQAMAEGLAAVEAAKLVRSDEFVVAVAAQNIRLRAALERYGRHEHECPAPSFFPDSHFYRCTCGLDAAKEGRVDGR